MAVDGGASEERLWSDIPGDLLAAVYLRSGSTYDRARFTAVCSSWSAAVAWHPRLPALPLLFPSTGHGKCDRVARAYSPEDGRVLRLLLPWFPPGNRLVGSYDGGWIATASGSDELLITNLFSGVRTTLTTNQRLVRKIVFSKDPSCSDCILAAMTSEYAVALCRVDCTDNRWTMQGYCGSIHGDLVDITFCNCELHGLTHNRLFKICIRLNKEGALETTLLHRTNVAMNALHVVEVSSRIKYIFELHDKVAIAVEVRPGYGCKKGHFIRVFELSDDDTPTSHRYTWAEVTSLGDHALFLGPAGCKAVDLSSVGRRGGVEGNHITTPSNTPISTIT